MNINEIVNIIICVGAIIVGGTIGAIIGIFFTRLFIKFLEKYDL